MIRILHVIGSMNCGGAETMIMNIYRCIDRSQIQFDFVLHTDKSGFYDKEILELGGNIYRTEKYNVKNIHSYSRWWNQFLSTHKEYKILHGHINSSAAIYLSIAKKYGLHTIVHSHATRITERSFRSFIFLVSSFPVRYFADSFMACSLQAGIDRFGKGVVNSDRFMFLPNGIDCKKYSYSEDVRSRIRQNYNLKENDFVIGHIGRFTYAKNHSFLLDVFYEYQKNNNAILMLLGTGELENEIKAKIETLGIENKVLMIGVKPNVYEYLQAMDCFVFPSLFEGLGIALVEAQAAGLPCIVSKAIQKEADIGANLLCYLDLGDIALWVECIKNSRTIERRDTSKMVQKAGFSIEHSSKMLSNMYIQIEESST